MKVTLAVDVWVDDDTTVTTLDEMCKGVWDVLMDFDNTDACAIPALTVQAEHGFDNEEEFPDPPKTKEVP